MGNLQSAHGEGLSKAELERMERRWAWPPPPAAARRQLPRLYCSPSAAAPPPHAQLARLPTPLALAPTSLARWRRLKRLGRGEKELARSDFQMIPELAGNPFLPRIFEMWVLDTRGWADEVWNTSGKDAGAAPICCLPLPRGSVLLPLRCCLSHHCSFTRCLCPAAQV